MTLGVTVACVGLLLLVLGILAVYPAGDVMRCREALQQARVIPTTGPR